MGKINFLDNNGTFCVDNPQNTSYLYFPLASEKGLKSAVTPTLGGDSKLDQNSFILEPVSSENIQENRGTRNFWCIVDGKGAWSATGASSEEMANKFTDQEDQCQLTAGMLWQKTKRNSKKYMLESEVLVFAPVDENVEIMNVTIRNTGDMPCEFTPVAAVPIYGRSADNLRDHRHVTSLLHRIHTDTWGVCVRPTLSFDERGHRVNDRSYFVCGMTSKGEAPKEFYPVVEDYVGEGGNLERPFSVIKNIPGVGPGQDFQGLEAMGGLRFEKVCLGVGDAVSYTVLLGITQCCSQSAQGCDAIGDRDEIERLVKKYRRPQAVEQELEAVKDYWTERVNVSFATGNPQFDSTMRWVGIQPELRRLFGCSFLPHHDYGRGGRGWRDLWQDCLALLIMNPSGVGESLINNFAGVRIDGSNATIIGSKPGEFVADRNNITRVWMDHGLWPFMTTKMYIDQTGDLSILGKQVKYFKDKQIARGTKTDLQWEDSQGVWQKDESGCEYVGTVLEHLVLQNLTAFYEVGDHNVLKLRGADWNDAMDMAADRGESVAFSNAYAGNLIELAELVEAYGLKTGAKKVELAKEMETLLVDESGLYDSVQDKQKLLADYEETCGHFVSGEKICVDIFSLAESLRNKGLWLQQHIRNQEWVSDEKGNHWFNGYYDNKGRRVEGNHENGVRMMLTSQVFAIMCKTATLDQVKEIVSSADMYLYKENIGGYRLNTDFNELATDLGRMFGFSYGDKENGAVFSHMTTMYGNALYKRGFAKEGFKVLDTLIGQSMDFEKSRIYPGIPEYFNGRGRGMYHYLTGAASWYLLTMVTEVFGVKGQLGDLTVSPKLIASQFDNAHEASVSLTFAGRKCKVIYRNSNDLEYGQYSVRKAFLDGNEIPCEANGLIIERNAITALNENELHIIEVELD